MRDYLLNPTFVFDSLAQAHQFETMLAACHIDFEVTEESTIMVQPFYHFSFYQFKKIYNAVNELTCLSRLLAAARNNQVQVQSKFDELVANRADMDVVAVAYGDLVTSESIKDQRSLEYTSRVLALSKEIFGPLA